MKLEKLMVSAVGAAAMIVIATAPAALAKGKSVVNRRAFPSDA